VRSEAGAKREDGAVARSSDGKLIIMSPTGGETGNRNLKLIQQLANWVEWDQSGIAFIFPAVSNLLMGQFARLMLLRLP
ncbi:MAG: Uma2 family endonuclease, partial [Halothece sp.]